MYQNQQKPKVSGQKGHDIVVWAMAWLGAGLSGGVLMVAPLALIALDISTGPQFIDSYTTANGIPLGGLSWVVPVAFSLATTGLQYSLFDRLEYGIKNVPRTSQLLLVVAFVVLIGDTVMDLGGITGWNYPDEVAANVIPSDPSLVWWLQAPPLAALCMLHEPMLRGLLSRFEENMADKRFAGHKLVQGGVKAGGWILNGAKSVALPVGFVSMIFLDLILTPQLGTSSATTWIMWITSFGLTALQILLWEHWFTTGVKRLSGKDKGMVAGAWVIAVFDTGLDVVGYTTAIYGNGTEIVVVPDEPTALWLLGAVVTGIVCFAGERMLKEMLWRPGQKGADSSGSGSTGGWGSSSSGSGGWGSGSTGGWGSGSTGTGTGTTGTGGWGSGSWGSGSTGESKKKKGKNDTGTGGGWGSSGGTGGGGWGSSGGWGSTGGGKDASW